LKNAIIKTILSLLIGALFVYLAIRGVDLVAVKLAIAGVDLWIVLAYVGIFFLVHLSRILRWGLLLKPIGNIRFWRLFTVASVGFMALMLLPLRLGEFARPIVVAEKGKIRISAAFATVVVERVIDALSMAGLLVALLFFVENKVQVPADLHFWSQVVLVGFLGLLGFLLLAYWRQDATVNRFKRLIHPLSPKLANRAASTLHSFIGGLRALPDLKLLGGVLGLTIIYWGLNGAGLWIMFGAFVELSGLGLIEAFTVLSVLCVGLMIPAGPGMIGNFHYFVKLGLSLFVAESVLGSTGVAYAIVVHAIQLGLQVLVGAVCLFSGHITLRKVFSSADGVE